jgi:hypothetical protein
MMRHRSDTPKNWRLISTSELAIIRWLLTHARKERDLEVRDEELQKLMVAGGCGCGCASIDFAPVPAEKSRIIADAIGASADGLQCGLLLWGRDNAISSLEIYELDSGSTASLPTIESLRAWHAP